MIATRRKERSQLYELLAAVHAGPLGYALTGKVRALAVGLYDLNLPELPPSPKAELYSWCYGFCAGCPQLGCGPEQPAYCLPEKFSHLAYSAGKGAVQRRLKEAEYIESTLIPCLDTVLEATEVDAYHSLLRISRRIAVADAKRIREEPGAY